MATGTRIDSESVPSDQEAAIREGPWFEEPDTRGGWLVHAQYCRGFDAETNAEFIRFLRYAKRSCTEVQSELYVASDEDCISPNEFRETYDLAGRTRAAVRGFINYLRDYEVRKAANPEP